MKAPTEKQIVIDAITRISDMSEDAVIEYRTKVSTSTLSKKAKEFIYQACDIKLDAISHRDDVLAVPGDIDDTGGDST